MSEPFFFTLVYRTLERFKKSSKIHQGLKFGCGWLGDYKPEQGDTVATTVGRKWEVNKHCRYNDNLKRRFERGRRWTNNNISALNPLETAISTFPASSIFGLSAKSMRPRARSFIRLISQINYNRQKFPISMTSEVRKCPKSAESDRNSGFLHLAIERKGHCLCNVKTKDAHAPYGPTVEIFLAPSVVMTFIFEKNRIY